ncbi:MAG: hypothetical protein E6R06_24615 [Mycobacterium sp.]|nr:MAG: hypothetical protein E6R06_24615 [Mycobacterium sp.]
MVHRLTVHCDRDRAADVRFGLAHIDWVGSIALDKKITGETGIYELTGIDRDEFMIIGLEWGAGELGAHNAHVIAVRRSDWDNRKNAADLGQIDAVDIQVHGVDPFGLLLAITHYLDIKMRLRVVENSTITITELLDSPPQED